MQEPYAATEQHILLLHAKRNRLTAALVEAERQYIAMIARELRAGRIDVVEARRAFHVLRDGDVPGTSKRWRDEMPEYTPHHLAQQARALKTIGRNSDLDVWAGTWPLDTEQPRPRPNQCVVYVLFQDGIPCYVGSTQNFASRLKRHEEHGKEWTTWQAHLCRDRAHAYGVENEFLRQYMPHLNVVGPRRPPGKEESYQ